MVNKFIMCSGFTLGIIMFIISIVLFFSQKIVSTTKDYLKIKDKKVKNLKTSDSNDIENNLSSEQTGWKTYIKQGSETEILANKKISSDINDNHITKIDSSVAENAQEYVTALLEANDSTEILPRL